MPIEPTVFPPDESHGPAVYATADELRDELGVDDTALDDAAAYKILEDATDEVDGMLGAWPILGSGDWEGRKLDPVLYELTDSQLDALRRATVKLGKLFYASPSNLDTEAAATSVSGPDFSVTYATQGAGQTPRLKTQARRILSGAGLVQATTTSADSPRDPVRWPRSRRVF